MKRYAFSDIHGNYQLLQDILKYCEEDSEIYFLGDAADRGNEGLQCMELLLNDNRVKYLMGNHEIMFLNAYSEHLKYNNNIIDDWSHNQMLLWLSNGGNTTWQPFIQNYSQEQQKILINKIKKLPAYVNFTNANGKILLLCHAGTSHPSNLSMEDIFWNRDHLSDEHWTDNQDIYIVHGHTPVISHYFNNKQVVQYCDNHKIDIDMGTYASNKVALLDLDSIGKELKVQYFIV